MGRTGNRRGDKLLAVVNWQAYSDFFSEILSDTFPETHEVHTRTVFGQISLFVTQHHEMSHLGEFK
jgi:hypothetical protein